MIYINGVPAIIETVNRKPRTSSWELYPILHSCTQSSWTLMHSHRPSSLIGSVFGCCISLVNNNAFLLLVDKCFDSQISNFILRKRIMIGVNRSVRLRMSTKRCAKKKSHFGSTQNTNNRAINSCSFNKTSCFQMWKTSHVSSHICQFLGFKETIKSRNHCFGHLLNSTENGRGGWGHLQVGLIDQDEVGKCWMILL